MKLLNAAECARLAERLQRVRAEAEPRWGRMRAAGMICHLTDAYRGVLGEREGGCRDTEGHCKSRPLLKYLALYAPMKWPPGVPTVPEADQGRGGTPPGDFETDREQLVMAAERFCQADLQILGNRHPIFGRMTLWEWRRWGWLHWDHHLRQFGE